MSDLSGQVILITGGTSGLGAASALALARLSPARIYISGRRPAPADAVIAAIAALPEPTPQVTFLPCDLASLASVRAAADTLLAAEPEGLDILLANAGVAGVAPALTHDGYEIHFGTNHLGHALLIRKLLPLLRQRKGRVVSVTSSGYRAAMWGIPFDKAKPAPDQVLPSDRLGLWRWGRYAESKLANIVYARELARRFPEVTAVSVSPGFVDTSMVAGMRLCDRVVTRLLAWGAGSGLVKAEDGARNQIWAATAPKGELENGGMYEPVAVLEKNLAAPVKDEKLAEKLWEWTEEEIASYL
ncbi:hypothetical protein B0H67DRAFT_550701 [Lasiosphaeris hirsuta]|uniref:Oxidoreductase n=1 Tax=Lasiosphaeris hirsuta TaxID=260670 RepID=A0AA40AZX4_9PEZI|nr:hypothetical protein B0H67DRAFT_550701 [Lasiosphaeris hirsuta]